MSDLHLMNYDASVTPDVLQPLLGLRSLSVFHLWSVPGPICHLQTWLTALTRLHSLSVHGKEHGMAFVVEGRDNSHLTLLLPQEVILLRRMQTSCLTLWSV